MDNISVQLSDEEMKLYKDFVDKVSKIYASEGEQLEQVDMIISTTPFGVQIEVGTGASFSGDSEVVRDLF